MEEQLITFETAKLAKEKGFEIPMIKVVSYYCENKNTGENYLESGDRDTFDKDKEWSDFLAPTQSLLQKWLREEKDYHLVPDFMFGETYMGYSIMTYYLGSFERGEACFKTYEEALEVGLIEALTLI